MRQRTLEKPKTITPLSIEEQKALHDIQNIRGQQEMDRPSYRVMTFEELEGTKIVSYDDYTKETVGHDPEGQDYITTEEITIDEKNELDFMYDMSVENDEREDDALEIEDERDEPDDFFRDDPEDIDREDDMEI